MIKRKQKHRLIDTTIMVVLLLSSCAHAELQLQFPGPAPGDGQGRINQSELVLENKVLACTWDVDDGQLKPNSITNKLSPATLQLQQAECFKLILNDGRMVKASDMKLVGKPVLKNLEPKPQSFRLAEHYGGKQITVI